MKLGQLTMRNEENGGSPIFFKIKNRINYLEQKNQCVNKKLQSYMNCFERRLLSERSGDSESKEKGSPTFRIHHSKKFELKEDPGRLSSENAVTAAKGDKMVQRNYKKESETKENWINGVKNLRVEKGNGLMLSKVSLKKREGQQREMKLESLKRGKNFLQKGEARKMIEKCKGSECGQRRSLKTDNFLQACTKQFEKEQSYRQMLKCLKKGNPTKHKKQQKLKVIQIKKKLLQEQEKSLRQYEECLVYKQKIAQKIKWQNNGYGVMGDVKKNFDQSQVYILDQSQVYISANAGES